MGMATQLHVQACLMPMRPESAVVLQVYLSACHTCASCCATEMCSSDSELSCLGAYCVESIPSTYQYTFFRLRTCCAFEGGA